MSTVDVNAYHWVHNTAQNSSDNLPSYPPDNHHSSDDVYWGEMKTADVNFFATTSYMYRSAPSLISTINIYAWPNLCR